MSDNEGEKKPVGLARDVRAMKIDEDGFVGEGGTSQSRISAEVRQEWKDRSTPITNGQHSPLKLGRKVASRDSTEASNTPRSPATKIEREDTVGGDITVKIEPGQAPKLSRTSSKKIMSKPPQLFLDLPDATSDASNTFEPIADCHYANKYLGTTDHALECDCSEEWGTSKPVFLHA